MMKIKFYDREHERRREYMKEYMRQNSVKNRAKVQLWRERNPGKNAEGSKRWRSDNADRSHQLIKRWHSEHPETRIMNHLITNMIRAKDMKKTSKSRQYIGCSPGFLRGWLEAQFKSGMTWDNYGSVWVVDHVVPLKWWDVGSFPQHLMEASHYSNLQPMFKRDNIIKGARFAG